MADRSASAELAAHLSRQPELDEHWPMLRAFLTVERAVGATFVEMADTAQRLAREAVGAERVVWALVADFCGAQRGV